MQAALLVPGPISLSGLQIIWAPALQLPSDAQSFIDARWSAHLADARRDHRDLFSAPVVTLLSHIHAAGTLTLTLAPGEYKTFLVTCLRDHGAFSARWPNLLAPALGNSCLLTHGGCVFLGLRSARVAAYPGHAHVFGGVLAPPSAEGAMWTPTPESILAHLYQELSEELHLTPDDLVVPPILLGLFLDPALHQPELIWHCPLRHPPKTHDSHEHDHLVMLDVGIHQSPYPLTPVAAAALKRLSLFPL